MPAPSTMSLPHRIGAALLVLALAALLSFPGLATSPISLHDEGRVAGIGREMLDAASWSVPLMNRRPFLEKPPLYWWAQIASYRALGVSELSARLPSGVFGFLTLLLTFGIGWRLSSWRSGLAALLVLGTTANYFDMMHRTLVDPALVFATALGTLGFLLWLPPTKPGLRRTGTWLWALSIPLSFLAKGIAGPAFTLAVPLLYLAAARRFRDLVLSARVLGLALALTALLVGPWVFAFRRSAGSGALKEMVLDQFLSRVFGGSNSIPDHAKPIWWYLLAAPTRLLPWILAVPAAIRARAFSDDASGHHRRALLWLFFLGFLLLSISISKRGFYLVPIFPAFAGGMGWWLATAGMPGPARRWDRPTLLLLIVVLAAVPLAAAAGLTAARFLPIHSAKYSVEAIRARLDTTTLAVAATGGLAMSIFLFGRFRSARRTGAAVRPSLVAASLVILLLAYQLGGKPILAATDTPQPMMRALDRLVPENEPILALRPRESLDGTVYFYLRRHVTPIGTGRAAERLLKAGAASHVLLRAEDRTLLPSAESDRWETEFREEHRARHPYEIVRLIRGSRPSEAR